MPASWPRATPPPANTLGDITFVCASGLAGVLAFIRTDNGVGSKIANPQAS